MTPVHHLRSVAAPKNVLHLERDRLVEPALPTLYFVENVNTHVWWYVSPGVSTVLGN